MATAGRPSAATWAEINSRDPRPALDLQFVDFESDGLKLGGWVFKPEGAGPFPAILWNHGSERTPGFEARDIAAAVFLPVGYVVFMPMRRGHGWSEGEYIGDRLDQTRRTEGAGTADRLTARLLETEQLDDQLAGLAFLKKLRFVDSSRLAVAGCSFGGIETLLAAEQHAGYKAAIAISPAAQSWESHPLLRTRLVEGVARIDIPTLLLQPARDESLQPSRVLGAEFRRLNKVYSGIIYPATGPQTEQTHCFGGPAGNRVWASDAIRFLWTTLNGTSVH